jgi:hypothetical protein
MDHDVYAPIVALIRLLDGVTVTGPDFDGWVRLTALSPGGGETTLKLGKVGEPAPEAALQWRRETALLNGNTVDEDDPLRDSLHHMDVHGPFGADIGD